MLGKAAIGLQSFEEIRRKNIFYVDKTDFIREWWENEDSVTLITRPRRFGKTLNLNMVECFFSLRFIRKTDICWRGMFSVIMKRNILTALSRV